MKELIQFSNSSFFIIFSAISILISLAIAIGTYFMVFKGVAKILYRLGKALVEKKVAILAEKNFEDIKELLVDSGIIREKNIIRIDKNNLKKMKICSVIIFCYHDCRDLTEAVLREKDDKRALIIYAEQKPGVEYLDKSVMEKINQERHTVLVNLRGRLLNDVFSSLITTQ